MQNNSALVVADGPEGTTMREAAAPTSPVAAELPVPAAEEMGRGGGHELLAPDGGEHGAGPSPLAAAGEGEEGGTGEEEQPAHGCGEPCLLQIGSGPASSGADFYGMPPDAVDMPDEHAGGGEEPDSAALHEGRGDLESDYMEKHMCDPLLGPFDPKLEEIKENSPDRRLFSFLQNVLKRVRVHLELVGDHGAMGAIDLTQVVEGKAHVTEGMLGRSMDSVYFQFMVLQEGWVQKIDSTYREVNKMLAMHDAVALNRSYLVKIPQLYKDHPGNFTGNDNPVTLMTSTAFLITVRPHRNGWVSEGKDKALPYSKKFILLEVRIDVVLESEWCGLRMNWFHWKDDGEPSFHLTEYREPPYNWMCYFRDFSVFVPKLEQLEEQLAQLHQDEAGNESKIEQIRRFCAQEPLSEFKHSISAAMLEKTVVGSCSIVNSFVRVIGEGSFMQNMFKKWNNHVLMEKPESDEQIKNYQMTFLEPDDFDVLKQYKVISKGPQAPLPAYAPVLRTTAPTVRKGASEQIDMKAIAKLVFLKNTTFTQKEVPTFQRGVTPIALKGQLTRLLNDLKVFGNDKNMMRVLQTRTLLLIGIIKHKKFTNSELTSQSIGSKIFRIADVLNEANFPLDSRIMEYVQNMPRKKRSGRDIDEVGGGDDNEESEVVLSSEDELLPAKPRRSAKKRRMSDTPSPAAPEHTGVAFNGLVQNIDKILEHVQNNGINREIKELKDEVKKLRADLMERNKKVADDEDMVREHRILTESLLIDFIRDEQSMKIFWSRMIAGKVKRERVIELLKNCPMITKATRKAFLASQDDDDDDE